MINHSFMCNICQCIIPSDSMGRTYPAYTLSDEKDLFHFRVLDPCESYGTYGKVHICRRCMKNLIETYAALPEHAKVQ